MLLLFSFVLLFILLEIGYVENKNVDCRFILEDE